MVKTLKLMGVKVLPESFADRTYESDGSLRKRIYSNALIVDPQVSSLQAYNISNNNKIIAHDGSEISIKSKTLCVHSDTPDALVITKAIKKKLNRS